MRANVIAQIVAGFLIARVIADGISTPVSRILVFSGQLALAGPGARGTKCNLQFVIKTSPYELIISRRREEKKKKQDGLFRVSSRLHLSLCAYSASDCVLQIAAFRIHGTLLPPSPFCCFLFESR